MIEEPKNAVPTHQHRKDILFERKGFTLWLVNKQGKSRSTAESYIATISTVFDEEFDQRNNNHFDNLRSAFSRIKKGELKAMNDLEEEYDSLLFCRRLIAHGNRLHTDEGDVVDVDAPKLWNAGFSSYLRYLRWRIDRLRQLHKLPIVTRDDNGSFIDLPFTKEFRFFLKNLGLGYTDSSINTHACKLRRVYNLFLRRVMKFDGLPDLGYYIEQGEPVNLLLDKIETVIDYEVNGHLAPEISYDDFSRGKKAFSLYKDFISDYVSNPNKYKMSR